MRKNDHFIFFSTAANNSLFTAVAMLDKAIHQITGNQWMRQQVGTRGFGQVVSRILQWPVIRRNVQHIRNHDLFFCLELTGFLDNVTDRFGIDV